MHTFLHAKQKALAAAAQWLNPNKLEPCSRTSLNLKLQNPKAQNATSPNSISSLFLPPLSGGQVPHEVAEFSEALGWIRGLGSEEFEVLG